MHGCRWGMHAVLWSKGPKMPTVIYRHRVRSARKGSLQKVDISSKADAMSPCAPGSMLHQDRLRAGCGVSNGSSDNDNNRWTPCQECGPGTFTADDTNELVTSNATSMCQVALPGRLMATRTLAAHALVCQSARRIQQHDPSTKVRAYGATPAGGPTLKDCPACPGVEKGPTAAQAILMDACPAMHPKGLFVESARDTLARRLDILQSSWLPIMVATQRS